MPESLDGAQNVEYAVDEDGILSLSIDTTAPTTKSGSGKTDVVASTHGNKVIASPVGQLRLGLNLFQYPDDRR